MNKKAILTGSIALLFISISLQPISAEMTSTQNMELQEAAMIEKFIDDWFKAGSKPYLYEIGKDEKVKHNEQVSYYLKSINKIEDGFGNIMRQIIPDEYRGKRIKLTGTIKSENIDNWAGMWMRVDGPEPGKSLQFDNMQNRPIKGSNEWTNYEIVLDVPENSTGIAYGVLVSGNGQIWFSSLSFEVVGTDVPSTNIQKEE